MFWNPKLPALGSILLMAAGSLLAADATEPAIVTLRQMKELTPAQAAAALPARLKGVVVCYDAGWHQLYVHDERETLYFNADDFATQPKKGDMVEITGQARGTNVLENPKLSVIGQSALPQAQPLELSDLARDHGEWGPGPGPRAFGGIQPGPPGAVAARKGTQLPDLSARFAGHQ